MLQILCRHDWADREQAEEKSDALTILIEDQLAKLEAEIEEDKKKMKGESGENGGEEKEEEEEDVTAGKSLAELRVIFFQKAQELHAAHQIRLPVIEWDGSLGEEEENAMRRIGFLFVMYECKAW